MEPKNPRRANGEGFGVQHWGERPKPTRKQRYPQLIAAHIGPGWLAGWSAGRSV